MLPGQPGPLQRGGVSEEIGFGHGTKKMERTPLANLGVDQVELLGPRLADVVVHCAPKQAEHKLGLTLVAQFQVFHEVREVNPLLTSAGEDRVHQLHSEFVEDWSERDRAVPLRGERRRATHRAFMESVGKDVLVTVLNRA